ncbi:MAG TPA: hypothetical protein VJ044_06890 [Candidatus Hodarchaeales archaeon]|nr:hypothetical protein [Candidatus Hodarchaeales archaeon]
MNRILDSLVFAKILLSRSASWASLLNSGMLLYIFLSNLQSQDLLVAFDLKKMFVLLYLATVSTFLIFGWIDRKIFYGRELKFNYAKFDDWNALKRDIQKIQESLKRIEDGK